MKKFTGYSLTSTDIETIKLLTCNTSCVSNFSPNHYIICAYVLGYIEDVYIAFVRNEEAKLFVDTFAELIDFCGRSIGINSNGLSINVHSHDSIIKCKDSIDTSSKLIIYNAEHLLKNPWRIKDSEGISEEWLNKLCNKLSSIKQCTFNYLLSINALKITSELSVKVEQTATDYFSNQLGINLNDYPTLVIAISSYIQAEYLFRENKDYHIVNGEIYLLRYTLSHRHPMSMNNLFLIYFLSRKHGIRTTVTTTGICEPILSILHICKSTIAFTLDTDYFSKSHLKIVNSNIDLTDKYYYTCSHDDSLEYVAMKLNQIKNLRKRIVVVVNNDEDIKKLMSYVNTATQFMPYSDINTLYSVIIMNVKYSYYLRNMTNYYIISLVDEQSMFKSNLHIVNMSKFTEDYHISQYIADSKFKNFKQKLREKYVKSMFRIWIVSELLCKFNLGELQCELLQVAYNKFIKYKSIQDYEQSMYRLAHELYTKYKNIES